jgi:hypothetical protein
MSPEESEELDAGIKAFLIGHCSISQGNFGRIKELKLAFFLYMKGRMGPDAWSHLTLNRKVESVFRSHLSKLGVCWFERFGNDVVTGISLKVWPDILVEDRGIWLED